MLKMKLEKKRLWLQGVSILLYCLCGSQKHGTSREKSQSVWINMACVHIKLPLAYKFVLKYAPKFIIHYNALAMLFILLRTKVYSLILLQILSGELTLFYVLLHFWAIEEQIHFRNIVYTHYTIVRNNQKTKTCRIFPRKSCSTFPNQNSDRFSQKFFSMVHQANLKYHLFIKKICYCIQHNRKTQIHPAISFCHTLYIFVTIRLTFNFI